MAGLIRRKQRWVGGAVSVGLHLAAIIALAFSTRTALPPARAPTPTLYIDIEPRPRIKGEVPRAVAAQSAAAVLKAQNPDPAPAPDILPPRPQPRQAQGPDPDTHSQDSHAWQVAPEHSPQARSRQIGQSLRTSVLGCQYPERLTQQERDVCDDREGERTARALERLSRGTGSANRRRDARFEAEGRQRLYAYEDRRRPAPDSQRGNGGVVEGVGSNFGMGVAGRHLDPTHQVDSIAPIQTKRDGPPEHRIRRTPH